MIICEANLKSAIYLLELTSKFRNNLIQAQSTKINTVYFQRFVH